MKTIKLIAATGALAAFATPASAAASVEFAPERSAHQIMVSADAMDFDIDSKARFNVNGWDDDKDRRFRRGRGRGARDRDIYDGRGRYREPRRIGRRDRIWRGRDGRYYCERDNGTTGLVIGAGVGALLGRTIDTDGDRTVGTLLGGALGAALGREIDRGNVRCR